MAFHGLEFARFRSLRGDEPERDMKQEKQLILIVEDELAIATMLAEWFTEQGYETRIAYDGAEALAILDTVVPAAITLDLYMPILNGYDLLWLIRQDPATRHVPVVVLSVAPPLVDELQQMVQGFIPKPFSPMQVLEYLQIFIGPADRE
jgi:CheY-like chemotaxis protein